MRPGGLFVSKRIPFVFFLLIQLAETLDSVIGWGGITDEDIKNPAQSWGGGVWGNFWVYVSRAFCLEKILYFLNFFNSFELFYLKMQEIIEIIRKIKKNKKSRHFLYFLIFVLIFLIILIKNTGNN